MSGRRASTSGLGRQRRKVFASLLGADGNHVEGGPSSQKRGAEASSGSGSGSAGNGSRRIASSSRGASSLSLNDKTAPANQHYDERIAGKFVQLANLDRKRPASGSGSLAHEQLQRREKRLLKADRRDQHRLLSLGLAETKKGAKGPSSQKERQKEEERPLSRRQRKLMGLEGLEDNVSYESLLPLHSMWLAYVQRLLGLPRSDDGHQKQRIQSSTTSEAAGGTFHVVRDASGQPQTVLTSSHAAILAATIVKADLCGAPIRVVQSLNPALVGMEGLIAKETESTFVIAPRPRPGGPHSKFGTRRPARNKIIPKRNSVFVLQISLPEHAITSAGLEAKENVGQSTAEVSPLSGQPIVSPYPAKNGSPVTIDPASMGGRTQHAIEIPLYGNQMCNTLPTRATRKYKARKTIDLD